MRSRLAQPDYVVLAIDQGTTSSRAILVDPQFSILGIGQSPLESQFPKPGWVEQDPQALWNSVEEAIRSVLATTGVETTRIRAIGITNQRETFSFFDRDSLAPLHPFIVWQCRRSASLCADLRASGLEPWIQKKSGLLLDPYFSGTKIRWLHESQFRIDPDRHRFATVDTYLVLKLTRGKVHVTDGTNASRTLLCDLETLEWSPELATLFSAPLETLPSIRRSSEIVGYTEGCSVLPDGIPIAGIAGDQHASLFGHGCFSPGESKCTYGTGAFLLTNVGPTPAVSSNRLLSTPAWVRGTERSYALEGSVLAAGAAIEWVAETLLSISTGDLETIALSAPSSNGVLFVPTLTGAGAPHWVPSARGALHGITRGTTRAEIARAALEGVAMMVAEFLEGLRTDLKANGIPLPSEIVVDGGMTRNREFLQLQANAFGIPVRTSRTLERTALGAAGLAGLAVSVWATPREIDQSLSDEPTIEPTISNDERMARQEQFARHLKALLPL